MESLYLKTLIESVNTGSLSKAADNLCVTPSAAWRRVRFLEDYYGLPLLDRSGSVLKPTKAGSLVIERAIKLIEIEKELLCSLRELNQKPRISFCCTPAFGIAFLPGILKHFLLQKADMNNLKFFFDVPDRIVEGLRENIFDMVVIEHCTYFDLSQFHTWSLPEDEMVFVSAPSLGIESSGVEIDIMVQQTLFSRNERCCTRIILDNNMRNLGRNSQEFKKIIVYDDFHLIIQAILNGAGIAFLSKSVVTKYLNEGSLHAHHVEGFTHNINRTFLISENKQLEPCSMDFAGSIFSAFSLPLPTFDAAVAGGH